MTTRIAPRDERDGGTPEDTTNKTYTDNHNASETPPTPVYPRENGLCHPEMGLGRLLAGSARQLRLRLLFWWGFSVVVVVGVVVAVGAGVGP